MNVRFLRLIQYCLLSLDLLSLNIIFFFAKSALLHISSQGESDYAYFNLMLNGSWIFFSWSTFLYHAKYISSFEMFCKRTMQTLSYWIVGILIYLYFGRATEISRIFIFVVLCSQSIMLLCNRFIYLVVRKYFRQRQFLTRNVAIIGYNETAKKLASYLEDESMHASIVGYCEEEENVRELTHYPVLCSVSEVVDVSKKYNVTEIYSTIAPEQHQDIYQLMEDADKACIHFRIIPDMSYFIKRSFHMEYLQDLPVLSSRDEPLDDPGNQIRKRIFDLAFSIMVILFLLSWLVPLLGILIKLESKGPVFFRQMRSGKNNKSFICYKFRSMRISADADVRQASRNDKRLTRIGRFIRKTNIDEFPQFFNVLKGDMSVVGPRPHMLKHTDDYSKLINEFMVRHFVKPGVTGWAQVNGYRGETKTVEEMEGRVKRDVWYLERWSLWLDIKIILMTLLVTIKGDKKAY